MTNVRILGNYYGYPSCCIREFEEISKDVNKLTNLQIKIAKETGTGFVPCSKHCGEIDRGEIEMSSLIHNRLCSFPFPQSDPEGAQSYLVNEVIKSA